MVKLTYDRPLATDQFSGNADVFALWNKLSNECVNASSVEKLSHPLIYNVVAQQVTYGRTFKI